MKYQCKECEHVFEGSSYSTQCPDCGNENIFPFKSKGNGNWFEKIKVWVKENKLIAAAIVLILVLILIDTDPPPPPLTKPNVYSLDFEEETNFCIIHLKDSLGKKVEYSQALYSFLKLEATMLSLDGTSYDVTVKKNKIEYCKSGDLSISYHTHAGKLRKLTGKYQGHKDILAINPSQSSGECIPKISIGDVMYMGSSCTVDFKVIEGEKYAYISINGKDGDYQKSKSFDVKDITQANFEVWYYPEGFSGEKKRFNNPKRIKEVLEDIEKGSEVASISNQDLKTVKQKLIKMIDLIQQNKISAADIIYLEIVEYLENTSFSISGQSYSQYVLTSKIQTFIQGGGTLKPLNDNIEVKSELINCGYIYVITISL